MARRRKLSLTIKETFGPEKVQDAIERMAAWVNQTFDTAKTDVALVGIQTRGAVLSKRVATLLQKNKNARVISGAIDITLYRDDVAQQGIQPIVGETNLDFDIDNKTLVLIDDVLNTGRTIRAALDEIMDFGRPKRIVLAVLIDRGFRELPIEPSFAAFRFSTKEKDTVNLYLNETDKREEIIIGEPAHGA